MPRALAIVLLLALAACDSSGVDATPYDGVIEVAAGEVTETSVALRLVAIEDTGCGDPVVATLSRDGRTRIITVEGIERPQGVTCLAIIPGSATLVFETGPDLLRSYPIEIRHAGETDAYVLSVEGFDPGSPATLTAVRTSTTRLAD